MESFNSSQGAFRSRRSYPSLHHISLAPLTPRFPIDDDEEPSDYFTARADSPGHAARTSYLSSSSVPSTPPVLSYSREWSARHSRSKSHTRLPCSDTIIKTPTNLTRPLVGEKKKRSTSSPRPKLADDSEWMLRAGIALASSTREEKGQSWLVKRESSTSLVSDVNNYDVVDAPGHHHHHHHRRSRSGMSTPAYSRRGSRSRRESSRGSGVDLAMTMTTVEGPPSSRHLANSSVAASSGGDDGSTCVVVPDFVDERIRAEMASIQQGFDDDLSSSSDEESTSEEDEIDEHEMQRLTRERGFGLGSWVDRLVEWTLFGVEEWPARESNHENNNNSSSQKTVRIDDDARSQTDVADEHDGASTRDDELSSVEKPGEAGGWEDAGWLFRVMKRALISV